ncbi:primase C-terminal domain-containing protein, partial [Vibrio sp. 10N.261.46.E8]|uniref:primase C-terminal domain-containing protein n=1 Tax=Vibrio sp. 10N.261.46.E8 TaxID=1880845 RepID=UPI0018E40E7E
GLGRNCDTARQWSYKAIRDYWAPNYKRDWNSAVYDQVEAVNAQFKVPLPVSEVKAIAKSIANWTYREFSPEKFRQSQAKKGAKGGKFSKGGGRPNGSVNVDSLNQTKPWENLGISRATYYRRLNKS